jgi:hypothetical protein
VDLDAAVAFQCALASADTSAAGAALHAKWNMGSVDVLWACMEKTWMEVAPSSEQVIEDVDRMLVVLDKIIAAGGCVVPDEFLRTGRRAVRGRQKGTGRQVPQAPADRNPGGPAPPPRVRGCLCLACGCRTRPEPHFPLVS